MRICHILETSGGGSAQVVLDLVRYGVQSGDEISVVYSLHRAEARFLDALTQLDGRVKIHTCAMRRRVGPHDVADGWHLYCLLRQAGPFDIVHSHSSKAGALARLVGPWLQREKHVYTPHAFVTMAPGASPAYGWAEWLLSWLCDAIICGSEQERTHAVARLKIPPSKLHVVPNGVALDYSVNRSEARERMGFADQDFVVGFVGRLVPQKNPLRLIEAFAIAARQRPDLRLGVVGDGVLLQETERALAAHGMGARARLVGGSDGRNFIPGFDCLLCSSDYESFGLVLLEALAAGVPAISTPVGIAGDAIVNGRTGFVATGFDADELAFLLLALVNRDQGQRGEMRAAARAQATRFSVEAMGEKTRTVYARVMGAGEAVDGAPDLRTGPHTGRRHCAPRVRSNARG